MCLHAMVAGKFMTKNAKGGIKPPYRSN
ncbi:hypothetical protein DBS1_20153 [Escherichia coli]|nr:hypothetical protein DBS1_20153 [Escherichia coli]